MFVCILWLCYDLCSREGKSSKIESLRKETSEDLKRANAQFHELQMTKDEESSRCKRLQEQFEELTEEKALLQKEQEDEKENHVSQCRFIMPVHMTFVYGS